MYSLHLIRIGVKFVVLVCFVSRVCSGLRCYTGESHKNDLLDHTDENLEKTFCSRKYQPQQQFRDDDDTISSILMRNISDNLALSETADVTNNCLIFYNPSTDVAEFSCDEDNICAGATFTKQTSMCHKGVRGSLFCCQGDLCNFQSYMRRLSPPQASSICYNGTNSGKIALNEVVCKSSWCYQSATFMSNSRLIEQKFGCEDRCAEPEFELNGATCREVFLHGGMHQRICYCSADRCNSRVHPITSSPVDSGPHLLPPTVSPSLKMHDPNDGQDWRFTRKQWFVMSWVSTAVLGLLLLSLVVIVVRRRRQEQSATSGGSIPYSQLNNETGEQKEPLNYAAVNA